MTTTMGLVLVSVVGIGLVALSLRMIYRGIPSAAALAAVTERGTLLTVCLAAGRIGAVMLRGRLLHVRLYTSGVVIRPLFLWAIPLRATDIRTVRVADGAFRREIEVTHTAAFVASPIRLDYRPALWEALQPYATHPHHG